MPKDPQKEQALLEQLRASGDLTQRQEAVRPQEVCHACQN